MISPIYVENVFSEIPLEVVLGTTPWIEVTSARLECFMSNSKDTYTYGSGKGIRTYTPVPFSRVVTDIMMMLNAPPTKGATSFNYNVCFLNRYDTSKNQLGWHADDSLGMDHDHPIAVVSFGQAREIWWKENEQTGEVPPERRQLLKHGSLFEMPAGFQKTHQHKIPKGDRDMDCRVSLTFRHYIP